MLNKIAGALGQVASQIGEAGGSIVGIRHGTEEPSFTVERRVGDVEIRQYGPRIAAETTIDADEEAARTISLTFKIKPESDRRTLHITTSAKTTLAGARDHASKVYLGKSTEGQMLLFLEDPRQDVLFEAPKATNNILDFKAGEQA